MDKKTVAERLQTLAMDDDKRSKTARLRDVLEDVEIALAAGAKRVDVLAELQAQGLSMSLATFETTLKRLRAKRRQLPPPSVTVSSYPTPSKQSAATPLMSDRAEAKPQPSHDPADLDRIIATRPNLAALARQAKRSKQ